MALSQLRPMVIEGDRPAPAAPQSGFTKLPDGSLIMRGTPRVMEKPGMLAGLRQLIASKLGPAPAPVDKYWIPPEPAPVAAAPVAAPAAQPMTPSLPGYSDWAEIEQETNKEQRIKEQLGGVSRNILGNERLIQGRWFTPTTPNRVD